MRRIFFFFSKIQQFHTFESFTPTRIYCAQTQHFTIHPLDFLALNDGTVPPLAFRW